MPLVLHQTAASPPARAALIVAELLGVRVEQREVSLPNRDHYKPEYLAKNPLHTVPLLEDGDLVLADSHAISTYLVSKYGGEDHSLYPKELSARAMVDQRLYFDATILFPRLRTVIYSLVRDGARGLTEQQVSDVTECYGVAERYLAASAFMAGARLSVADVACVTTLSSLDCVLRVGTEYPRLHDWWRRLREQSWYRDINEPGLRVFGSFIKQYLK